ncbi:cytochrome c biogenesis protein ResB [Phosphitispora sp. TUW77]|uniref:cytochrome c biogenesis protein ResB n=1 Tax=Phosphitispora sp. TUW77 TaxID=3152361 RepID=UPI003AB61F4B
MPENRKKDVTGTEERNILTGKNDGSKTNRNIIDIIWNFFSSMKLAIILLLVLAAASIIGTIWVPLDIYGQPDYLKFYNHPVFNIILILLALNILICSFNRWKSIASTLRGPSIAAAENIVKRSGETFKIKAEPAKAAEKVKELLLGKGYRIFESHEGEVYKIASDKGHLGILGPYLTHLSFFVIVVAVIIKFSGLVGFDGTFVGWEGGTYSIGDVHGIRNVDYDDYFDIRVNRFRTEYRPDGREIKQWYSDVTVIDGDKETNFTIYVNKPLVYNGIKLYQSSFGHQYTGKYSGTAGTDQQFIIGQGGQEYLWDEGTKLAFVPTGFEDATEKVKLQIYRGQQIIDEVDAVLNQPIKYEDVEVVFEGVKSYTVLSAKRDPGVPIIGAGSILLIAGVVISFILRQRRIWSIIRPDSKGALVEIGGISAKDKRGLDIDIAEITAALK